MSVLISNGDHNLSDANAFYRVESYNLSDFHATTLALTTTRTIPVTFTNAGNCQGLLLSLYSISMTDRTVVVTLQENVASVWTDRVSKTMTTAELTGGFTSGTYANRGEYYIPFIFGTPYAVDTTASKWRFSVAHGTGTGTWNLKTSDATNPFYATWCDNALSFTNSDALICKDYIIIDQSATLGGVLGTGDTANGISGVICSNVADATPANVAFLKWDDTPASAYTLTVGGQIMLSNFSGFRCGTSTNRIPIAQKATITFTAPTVGTATAKFCISGGGVAAQTFGGTCSLFFYGEIPTYQKTTLSSDAATGQAHLITTDNVNWVNGDTVVIGKQNAKGQGDTTIYTVSSVSGNDITLTGNVASYLRYAGAEVLKLNSHGILIQNTSSNSTCPLACSANLQFSGVDLYNFLISHLSASYYYYLAYLGASYSSQYLFEDITSSFNFNSSTGFLTGAIPPAGILVQRCYCFRCNQASALTAYYANGYKSGRATFQNCVGVSVYGGSISVATNTRITYTNNVQQNARGIILYFCGVDGIYTNNYFWGNSTTGASGGSVSAYNAINATIGGNHYDNNTCALTMGLTTVNCIDTDSVFGAEMANTVDICILAGANPDYTLKSPTGNLVIDETYLPDMVVGGALKITDFNDIAKNDKVYYSFGKTQRTHADLADTTMHTAGGSAVRFEPIDIAESFEFSFDVPTGDIQNKTMSVSIWCKLNSVAYYAGDDDMPRLTVQYDGTSEVYSEVVAGTGWQLLSVNFAPTTTTGKITITLSGRTDATGTDRYFYWDDISILYPAGYTFDLGGLDIWDNALPVLPPIFTLPSAESMLDAQLSNHQISGSAGEAIGLAPVILGK